MARKKRFRLEENNKSKTAGEQRHHASRMYLQPHSPAWLPGTTSCRAFEVCFSHRFFLFKKQIYSGYPGQDLGTCVFKALQCPEPQCICACFHDTLSQRDPLSGIWGFTPNTASLQASPRDQGKEGKLLHWHLGSSDCSYDQGIFFSLQLLNTHPSPPTMPLPTKYGLIHHHTGQDYLCTSTLYHILIPEVRFYYFLAPKGFCYIYFSSILPKYDF